MCEYSKERMIALLVHDIFQHLEEQTRVGQLVFVSQLLVDDKCHDFQAMTTDVTMAKTDT